MFIRVPGPNTYSELQLSVEQMGDSLQRYVLPHYRRFRCDDDFTASINSFSKNSETTIHNITGRGATTKDKLGLEAGPFDLTQELLCAPGRACISVEAPCNSLSISIPGHIHSDMFPIITHPFQGGDSRFLRCVACPVEAEAAVALNEPAAAIRVKVGMEEHLTLWAKLTDSACLAPVNKDIAIGEDLHVALAVCRQVIGCWKCADLTGCARGVL